MVVDIEQITEVKEILGDKTKQLVENYLADTQRILSEIDVSRATQTNEYVINAVHTLKSSSFQVGAHEIMQQAAFIETELRENIENASNLNFQTQLDQMIHKLRTCYDAYQNEIFSHV